MEKIEIENKTKKTKKLSIKSLAKELIKIVVNSNLDLKRENKKSRVTFLNSRRVLSLEVRKRYILVHLPRLDYLKKSNKVKILEVDKDNKFRAKLLNFSLTRDSRSYTYIRIYTSKEIEDFKEVLEIASSFNR